MIRGIIFDCFGVLVGQGFWRTYQAAGGDPVRDGEFLKDTLQQTNSGMISSEAFSQKIAARLGIGVDAWTAVVRGIEVPNQPLFDYIRSDLQPHYKLGFLCNANIGVVERRIPADLLGIFDDRIISAEVGLLKPDPRIYRLASQRLGLPCTELVFCDDKPVYTAAAAALGMQTIVYTDFASFRRELEALTANADS